MAARKETHLELVNIRRSINHSSILDCLSLRVHRGEFVTILGPSGSGKTTTLNLIAGFDFPDAGAITLGGRDITRVPSYARGIGMVFQNYALFPHLTVAELFPHLTVAENVAFPLRMRRCRESEVDLRVSRALDLVQMRGLDDRYPSQLSGGQGQRVAIARAAVYEPRLLLMDEPLGALDRKLRSEMQFEIKRLHRELEMTILYVTHDQEEALAMSDRIAVLEGGHLEQCATPQELYERPKTRFVASFIGETNFVEASATLRDAGWVASCRELGIEVPLDPSSAWTPRQRLMLSIRPEHIQISPACGAKPSARVDEVQYLGESVRCRLKQGETVLTVKLPAHTDASLLMPGAMVEIAIDRAKLRVFAELSGLISRGC